MDTETSDLEGVQLRASVVVSKEELRASYEVQNRSGQDIYVVDAMFRPTAAGPVLEPNLAYTVLEDDVLTLFRGIVRIPRGKQVEAPDLPLARLVAAGSSVTGTIEAPLPLAFHDPYAWPKKGEMRTAHKLRLRIGWLAAKDLDPAPAQRVVQGTELYSLRYFSAVDKQHFVETPVQDGSLMVLVRH